jgi:hypothetical protein
VYLTLYVYNVNGLHPHTAAFTPKLTTLPRAKPPTRKKLARVAATFTSSGRPFKHGLCSNDGAAIIHRLETYPFENLKQKIMSMYISYRNIIPVSIRRG